MGLADEDRGRDRDFHPPCYRSGRYARYLHQLRLRDEREGRCFHIPQDKRRRIGGQLNNGDGDGGRCEIRFDLHSGRCLELHGSYGGDGLMSKEKKPVLHEIRDFLSENPLGGLLIAIIVLDMLRRV